MPFNAVETPSNDEKNPIVEPFAVVMENGGVHYGLRDSDGFKWVVAVLEKDGTLIPYSGYSKGDVGFYDLTVDVEHVYDVINYNGGQSGFSASLGDGRSLHVSEFQNEPEIEVDGRIIGWFRSRGDGLEFCNASGNQYVNLEPLVEDPYGPSSDTRAELIREAYDLVEDPYGPSSDTDERSSSVVVDDYGREWSLSTLDGLVNLMCGGMYIAEVGNDGLSRCMHAVGGVKDTMGLPKGPGGSVSLAESDPFYVGMDGPISDPFYVGMDGPIDELSFGGIGTPFIVSFTLDNGDEMRISRSKEEINPVISVNGCHMGFIEHNGRYDLTNFLA